MDLTSIKELILIFTNAHRWKFLPKDAKTLELTEAMKVLEKFSDQEAAYSTYQSRLAAMTARLSEEAEYAEIEQRAAEITAAYEQIKQDLAEAKIKAAQEIALTKAKAAVAEEKVAATEAKALSDLRQQSITIAHNLLAQKTMTPQQIAQVTGLTVEEVENPD